MNETQNPQERRREKRHQPIEQCAILVANSEYVVKLIDISASGIKVEGISLPVGESAAILFGHDTRIEATIVWSKGLSSGLNFKVRLEPGHFLLPR